MTDPTSPLVELDATTLTAVTGGNMQLPLRGALGAAVRNPLGANLSFGADIFTNARGRLPDDHQHLT